MTDSLNRRTFLGTSAVAAAGLSAVGNLVQANDKKEPKTITVGVMGLSRGRALGGTFAKTPGVVVKYACDIDKNRAAAGAKYFNKINAGKTTPITELQQLLDDKEVDALVCAAPNHWHAPATILACNAGKHVYVEKPCSHNAAEGEMMVAAARKHHRCVQMGTQRRSAPTAMAAIKELHDGVIGRVFSARSFYHNARGTIGKGKLAKVPEHVNYDLWQGPAPRRPYVDNLVHYNWHWRWHWGNGELGNNGVHSLDLCRWGMQVDYPTQISSGGGRYRFDDDQETPDTHVVSYEFGDQGQITWQCQSNSRHKAPFVVFFGEKGSMEIDGRAGYVIYNPKHKAIKKVSSQTAGEPEHVANFIDAIRANDYKSLNQEIESGHMSTMLCHLGNIAQRTGRTINCNSKNGHIIGDDDAIKKYWAREYEKGWEPKV